MLEIGQKVTIAGRKAKVFRITDSGVSVEMLDNGVTRWLPWENVIITDNDETLKKMYDDAARTLDQLYSILKTQAAPSEDGSNKGREGQ